MASLSHLLAVPALGLRLVQAGPSDPAITWISTTELRDLAPYLEGGEVVLTTGLSFGEDDPGWLDFVAGLSRARAAAIGFGVGVEHPRTPRALVAAASAYRLALFEVPPPTPFIAVSKAAAGLLQADELRAARHALGVQQRLLDGARGGQGPAELLSSIAQATGRRLALRQGDGTLIAAAVGFPEDAPGTESVPLDAEGDASLLLADGPPLEPEERAVVAAGAMVLGLELRGARREEERERRRWAALTEGLLRGEALGAAATILAPEMELPRRIRAIAVQGDPERIAAWFRAQRHGLDRLVTPGEPRGAGLAVARQLCADAPEAVDRAVESLRRFGLDCIVGRPAALAEAPLSLRSAERRLDALPGAAGVYRDPRLPIAVRAEEDAPLLEALLEGRPGEPSPNGRLCAAVLGPLARPAANADATLEDSGLDARLEPAERESLRETLRVFLAHGGRRQPAAEQLGIHRNTLRDRLARIERITGRLVDDADHRAELWLALRLEEALG